MTTNDRPWSKPQINTRSEAIKMFRKVGVNIEPPEHNVSFALSSLLIVFVFGFPPATASQHQTKAESLDELFQIFKLSRKMIKFAKPTMNEVHTSKIGSLLLVEEVQSSLSFSSRVVINALGEQLNTVCSPTHEHHQAFADTVACLEKLDVELDGTEDIVSGAFMWSCDVPETFIALVPTSNPFALGDYSTLLCCPAPAEKVLVDCIMAGAGDECHYSDFGPGMEAFCSLGS